MFSLNGVGGVADRHGGLKRGDQLLSVNGVNMQKIQKLKIKIQQILFLALQNNRIIQKYNAGPQVSVEGEHHEKAVELLKAAPASVKLVVRYTPKVCFFAFNFCLLHLFVRCIHFISCFVCLSSCSRLRCKKWFTEEFDS